VERTGKPSRARNWRCIPGWAALLLFALPSSAQHHRLFQASHAAMGTTFSIYLYAASAEKADEEFTAAFDEIDGLDQELSNYRMSSEVSRINAQAGREAVTMDPEMFAFLQRSLQFSRLSGGAFDVTVGPLMRAWGFFRGQGRYPSTGELAQAHASVGWQYVELDRTDHTVRFLRPGLEIDFGGIGKGYAVDRVADLLRQDGITAALIDAGSSTIYALGAPPGTDGWKVQVPRPAKRSEAISTIRLRDESLSTSGSYEKFFILNGHTYCHIMDPRTGEPVQGVLQTTVIAADGTTSDALSTAMFVMGPNTGRELLKSIARTQALWVLSDSESVVAWRWPSEVHTASVTATSAHRNRH
jgi:thiamine biosynthesis lipoprotein